ncbi:MAG: hypothetical protein HY746_01360 [Elusimicrobia bacterium]|nr:hypothetical protein [Elusimicrobiota bacterium]
MKKIIILIMLITPVFANAQDGKVAVTGINPQNAPSQVKKKTDVYRTIADELLKNIEDADKKIGVPAYRQAGNLLNPQNRA